MAQVTAILFIVAVPLILVAGNVTWAVNDLRLQKYGFDKHDVPLATGMEKDELVRVARQIRGYFNSTHEPLEVRATVLGEERDLFNEREVLHMKDVKRLIWGVYAVDAAAALYLLGYVGVGLYLRRRWFVPDLLRGLVWGCGLTVGLVALVGLVSLVGFDGLFRFFHEVSFANDFWQLDPRTDFLVRMYPQGFWFESTLFVALATVIMAAVVGGIAATLLVRRRHAGKGRERVLRPTSKAVRS